MPRWQPNASERLVVAALDLFATQGYENTTVIDIATRAGLTKSTFFRHFSDKREVLFGADPVTEAMVAAIAGAPADAGPFEALAAGADVVGAEIFVAERRERVARRRAVIAAHAELQEREALKGLRQVAAMTDALARRGLPELTARVAAQLGALALKTAYERWSDASTGASFAELARAALEEVRVAVASATATTVRTRPRSEAVAGRRP